MNVQHLSSSAEHGTPLNIVESARSLMGGIDLDPASDAVFNKYIKAEKYYTAKRNGFTKDWNGHVLLNPPGGRCDSDGHRVTVVSGVGFVRDNGKKADSSHSAATWWWFKLASEWALGHIREAVFIGFSLEVMQRAQLNRSSAEEKFSCGQLPLPMDFPFCIPYQRLRFMKRMKSTLEPSSAPTHASIIVFLHRHPKRGKSFEREFSKYGAVILP